LKTDSTIFFGGPIYTLAESGRPARVEALAVRDGRIAAVGTRSQVQADLAALDGCSPRLIDLEGATLLPGFVDSHTHFLEWALFLDWVDLEGVPTLEQALEKVARFAAGLPKGEWVRGGRWNKNLWERAPNRRDLDRVVPDHPVVLGSKDMHSYWLNTAALRLVGINRDTPDPPGGEIERDDSGEPTGILRENAAALLGGAILGEAGPSGRLAALRKAIDRAHAMGLVGVSDMEGREAFKLFQSLDRAGELSLRVWLYLPEALLPQLAEVGLESGFGGANLKVAGVKAFLDGSLGSQTADMLEPFEGTQKRGIATMTPEAFDALVERASREGLAVAVHAIGDHAVRVALDGFEKHRELRQAAGLRHRIEHLQLFDPADLPRIGRLGVVASMQPIHAPSDRDIADRYWGPRRSASAYAWRSVAEAGAVLAFGSDVPVEDCNPLGGLFAAVTRRHPEDPAREPWHPEQAVSPVQAVRAYTVGAAWAVGAERERGTLEPGKAADFVILSEDILKAGAGGGDGNGDGEVILKAKVLGTAVAGRFVYGEARWSA